MTKMPADNFRFGASGRQRIWTTKQEKKDGHKTKKME